MDELGRRAGRGQGRGDLARDVAGFAHAGHGDAPGHRGEQVQRVAEIRAQRVGERVEPFGLQAQHPAAGVQVLVRCLVGRVVRSLRVLVVGLRLHAHPWLGPSGFMWVAVARPKPRRRRAPADFRPGIRPDFRPDYSRNPRPRGQPRIAARSLALLGGHQWAKISTSGQPARSSAARAGRNSKQARARAARSSRSSIASRAARRRCR